MRPKSVEGLISSESSGKVTEGTDWVAENANKFMKKLTNELSGTAS